jgi:cytosine/adenosine deaminase-related metal-dependent hydrolase
MSLNQPSSNNGGSDTVLRARIVVPAAHPPIEDGAVVVSGNRIASVGRWRDVSRAARSHTIDLGERALLPGLVNAHCHLDYTGMAGQISPTRKFTDWLKLITTNKGGWGYSEFAQSWLDGAQMLLRTGTTTVGDIEMVPEILPEAWTSTPLRVFSFIEMTGVKSRRPPAEIIREALDKIAALPAGHCRLGLSPHAPYSTTPELLRLAADAARRHDLRFVTHVAESGEEFDMFMHGRGGMYNWLARGGRDMSDCGLGSPVQHLERQHALSEQLLAVHVNYLAPGDALLLAKHKVHVVHCPRSHAYFKHRRFPLEELALAGVNLCLGTDSLASVNLTRKQPLELNLFEEMRQLAGANPAVPPDIILQMATVNGARALGMQGQIGELSPGAFADLIAIPFAGRSGQIGEAILHHQGAIAASMIDGHWAIAPHETARSHATLAPA